MRVTLTMTGAHHDRLRSLLFPGDGKESAAIALCGQAQGPDTTRLLMQDVHPIFSDAYSARSENHMTWNTDVIVPLLNRAEREGLTFFKFHSHPNGLGQFSSIDTTSDQRLLPAVRDWIEAPDRCHGSAVMLPDGSIFARYIDDAGILVSLDAVTVVGGDVLRWSEGGEPCEIDSSHVHAFGEGTFRQIGDLAIAVVGCSGTGGPVVEQLSRLRPRKLVLIDDDVVEPRNLNRIPNTTAKDAEAQRPKVDVLAQAVRRMGLGTEVVAHNANLASMDAIRAVASCDVVFGCMDSIDGRYLLNRLATYYLLPYIDIGVRLVVDEGGRSEIRAVCGTVHYLMPGGSSLISRGLFKLDEAIEEVRIAGLKRRDPGAYLEQTQVGYIRGAQTTRPAVVSINGQLASMAVTELLARIHPFRDLPNGEFDRVEFDFAGMQILHQHEPTSCPHLSPFVGQGDRRPLLGLTEFSERQGSA